MFGKKVEKTKEQIQKDLYAVNNTDDIYEITNYIAQYKKFTHVDTHKFLRIAREKLHTLFFEHMMNTHIWIKRAKDPFTHIPYDFVDKKHQLLFDEIYDTYLEKDLERKRERFFQDYSRFEKVNKNGYFFLKMDYIDKLMDQFEEISSHVTRRKFLNTIQEMHEAATNLRKYPK